MPKRRRPYPPTLEGLERQLLLSVVTADPRADHRPSGGGIVGIPAAHRGPSPGEAVHARPDGRGMVSRASVRGAAFDAGYRFVPPLSTLSIAGSFDPGTGRRSSSRRCRARGSGRRPTPSRPGRSPSRSPSPSAPGRGGSIRAATPSRSCSRIPGAMRRGPRRSITSRSRSRRRPTSRRARSSTRCSKGSSTCSATRSPRLSSSTRSTRDRPPRPRSPRRCNPRVGSWRRSSSSSNPSSTAR